VYRGFCVEACIFAMLTAAAMQIECTGLHAGIVLDGQELPRPSFGAIQLENGGTPTMLALDGNSLVAATLGHLFCLLTDGAP